MARRTKKVRKPVPPAPDLPIRLFAPGMSALHRVGLGGLACTLKAMERLFENGLLREDKLPAPFADGKPPWDIDEQSVTLRFGKPENTRDYLKKLFAFAFQIRDGVIYLPGQYPDPPPSLAVRAAIQDGIQNTFLQHGPTCGRRLRGLVLRQTSQPQPIIGTPTLVPVPRTIIWPRMSVVTNGWDLDFNLRSGWTGGSDRT